MPEPATLNTTLALIAAGERDGGKLLEAERTMKQLPTIADKRTAEIALINIHIRRTLVAAEAEATEERARRARGHAFVTLAHQEVRPLWKPNRRRLDLK